MAVFYEALGETEIDEEESVRVTDWADYNVLGFYVSVENSTVVDLFQPRYHLICNH